MRTFVIVLGKWTAVSVAVAVAVMAATALSGGQASAATRSWADGVWRTDGYGMVVSIGSGHGMAYQTTAISCLLAQQANQIGPPGRDGTLHFGTGGVTAITVRPDGPGHALLHTVGAAGNVGMRRIRVLPRMCVRPAPRNPVRSFRIFGRTFAENYPFFAAQKINWRAVENRYRRLINTRTTRPELYQILANMIRPLGNAHTYVLSADHRHVFQGLRPGTRPWSAPLCAKAAKVTDARLGGPLSTWGYGALAYATLPGRFGYLRISSFQDYAGPGSSVQTDRTVLSRALSAVFTRSRTRRLRGLIIDVRCNPGGNDALGLQVASRLTRSAYLAYAKRARGNPGNPARFTPLQPIVVHPARGPAYGGPIAILTSDMTVSAGETFTQAMMGRSPQPVRIGQSTQGVFSDIMNRLLPDGIIFGLPNERYLTRDGQAFDNRGIPPNIPIAVFTPYQLSHGQDAGLAAARTFLSGPSQRYPRRDR